VETQGHCRKQSFSLITKPIQTTYHHSFHVPSEQARELKLEVSISLEGGQQTPRLIPFRPTSSSSRCGYCRSFSPPCRTTQNSFCFFPAPTVHHAGSHLQNTYRRLIRLKPDHGNPNCERPSLSVHDAHDCDLTSPSGRPIYSSFYRRVLRHLAPTDTTEIP
jgi:hypothetical protein